MTSMTNQCNQWLIDDQKFCGPSISQIIDYSLIIGNNHWLINWLPIDYLLITHWFHLFHWCHWLFMSGRGNLHTTPEEVENGTSFPKLGLPLILIRHENGVYAPQTGGIWKRRLCILVWTENNLKRKLFENGSVAIIMIFPCQSYKYN